MKKSDLKTGHIVESRASGSKSLVVINNCYGEDGMIHSKDSWSPFTSYDDDLRWTFCGRDKDLDIVKVYEPRLPTNYLDQSELKLVWCREKEDKEIEVTMKQINKKFGCKVKIVGD